MKNEKRAVSPVVSTLLLVMIVIVLAIIILLWGRGFIKEAVSKQIGDTTKTADKYCAEIFNQNNIVSTPNDDGTISVENQGTIPIYAFQLKLTEADSGDTTTEEIASDKKGSINPGGATIIDTIDQNQYESIEMIPILLGMKQKATTPEPYLCSESYAIIIK